MTTNPLSAASLAIYILLLQPSLYSLYRHGWPGFLGWFYLQLFCILRIVSNALSLTAPLDPAPLVRSSTASSDKTSLVVNNIGLSPLLLATAGVLHEARRARRVPGTRSWASKYEWHLVFNYHFLVSVALALIVAGVLLLENTASVANFNTAADLTKAGSAVVLLCWVLLIVWVGVSFLGASELGGGVDYAAGSKLIYAVIIALPLIALRLVYGVTSLLLTVTGHPTSTFSTSLALKVVLETVPEMLLVIVFVVAGFATRDVAGAYWKKTNVRMGNGGAGKMVSRV